MDDSSQRKFLPILDICSLFLFLGCTCFGGMWAAMDRLHKELVERRGLLTADDQKSLMLAAAIIPAPKFLAFAAMIGYRIGGATGAIASSVCILIPGAGLVLVACAISILAADNPLLMSIQHFVGLGVVGLLGGNALSIFFGANRDKSSFLVGFFISLGIPIFVVFFDGSLIVAACIAMLAGSIFVHDTPPTDKHRAR